jgi:hypothetical protein
MKRAPLLLALMAFLVLGLSCAPRDETPPPETTPLGPSKAGVDSTPPIDVPDALRPRIDTALDNVRRRDMRIDFPFWSVFHGILGLGPDFMLLDDKTGKRVNALDYVCGGGDIRGLEFVPTPDGLDVATWVGTGVGQGHQDQFVSEMVQWGVSPDRKVVVDGKTYKFVDFFAHSRARASVTKNQELSWAIIIIGTHYGTDHQWTNSFGEKLSFEDIVRYELDQPIDTAACGGTHRLFGLTWAYHLHRAKGKPDTGVWKDVAAHIEKHKKNARDFRNRADGSFSTAYVSKDEHNRDFTARIASTGHVLEWLTLALSDDELREAWVQEAASALSLMILDNASRGIDVGATYHAVHGLYIYRARVFGVPGPPGLQIPLPPK